ncbi:unnamed protein product [Didymodactylos carnosus]|uniref:Tyrosine specific protein phosphatases domain-containing protein n=1 Tax=Didymodactylos carnosus TaxID=1234261 RepID=A0A813UNI8_9BILA|nr:unnamed protein product [Didymodactylos carnosus]CAF1111031.1 unnamed protein product [Didymodactylos carnosus]CAF3612967.1 unnamed protein product [Didymodactylos carnosus]CAF3878899.1 unnamed protein product [Didymodactylos carnosus]
MQNLIPSTPMPPYFQWVIDNLLAISAHPYHASHIKYLLEHKIQTIISVSDNQAHVPPHQSRGELHVLHMDVPDGGAPTTEQIQQFVNRMDVAKQRNEGIVVECIRGKGAAAVLVGCYLMKIWQSPPDYVVNQLRLMRPIALETPIQEQTLIDYHKIISPRFYQYYAEVDMPHSWDIDTSYLRTTNLATTKQLSLA